MPKEQLTHEALRKHFKNNFELANYAIAAARYFIRSGHEVDIETLLKDIQNNPRMYDPTELAAMEEADRQESPNG